MMRYTNTHMGTTVGVMIDREAFRLVSLLNKPCKVPHPATGTPIRVRVSPARSRGLQGVDHIELQGFWKCKRSDRKIPLEEHGINRDGWILNLVDDETTTEMHVMHAWEHKLFINW